MYNLRGVILGVQHHYYFATFDQVHLLNRRPHSRNRGCTCGALDNKLAGWLIHTETPHRRSDTQSEEPSDPTVDGDSTSPHEVMTNRETDADDVPTDLHVVWPPRLPFFDWLGPSLSEVIFPIGCAANGR